VTSVASSIRDDASDVSASSSSLGKKRNVLVQSRGLYRPAKNNQESQADSGASTPTFAKKISLTDLNGIFYAFIHSFNRSCCAAIRIRRSSKFFKVSFKVK
jgi:hypothetical protein